MRPFSRFSIIILRLLVAEIESNVVRATGRGIWFSDSIFTLHHPPNFTLPSCTRYPPSVPELLASRSAIPRRGILFATVTTTLCGSCSPHPSTPRPRSLPSNKGKRFNSNPRRISTLSTLSSLLRLNLWKDLRPDRCLTSPSARPLTPHHGPKTR